MTNNEKKQGGYGQPPAEKQFKKGQSGNPKGRPKGAGNSLENSLIKELGTQHVVNVNGRRMKIRGDRMLAKRIIEKAANGDRACLSMCLKAQEKMPGGQKALNKAYQEQIAELQAALVQSRKNEGGRLYLEAPYVHALEEEMALDPEVAIQMVKDNPKLFEEYIREYFKVRGHKAPVRDE